MTQAGATDTSLAILVDRLVAFLRDQPKPKELPLPDAPFSGELARVWENAGHHIVALMLVARSDDRVFGTERRVIEHHVEERARKAGFELTSAERITLADYLRGFGPPETQLDAALERLKHDPREEISDLIETAHAVVEADGVMRLQEALFLSSLRRDLAAL